MCDFHPGKPSLIALASFALVFFASTSQAAITFNTGSSVARANSLGSSGQMEDSSTGTSGLLRDNAQSGNVSGPNFADASTWLQLDFATYDAASFAKGTASASSEVTRTFKFTADNAGTYSMNSLIYGGNLASARAGNATGSGEAYYAWELKVNDELRHFSTTRVSENGTSSARSTSGDLGVTFANRAGYESARWGRTNLATPIGYLDVGDMVDVSFKLSTYSIANYIMPAGNVFSGIYGFPCFLNGDCGGSAVSFGDPSFLFGNATSNNQLYTSTGVFSFQVSPVPEPAEWAMMLAGLGAVAAIAKRRKRPA
jgi:hypothetical protein